MSLRYVILQAVFLSGFGNFTSTQITPAGEEFVRPPSEGLKLYPSYQGGGNLQEQLAKKDNADAPLDISITHITAGGPLLIKEENLASYLRTISGASALVVEATPFSNHSFICANSSFICSDYSVRINTIYRVDQEKFHGNEILIRPGQTIIVSRPGGDLVIGKHRVHAFDPQFLTFELGLPYIFALRWDEKSKTFEANAQDSFLLGQDGYVKRCLESAIKLPGETHPFHVEVKAFRSAIAQASQETAR